MEKLLEDKLVFDRGNSAFDKKEFANHIGPHMDSLKKMGRDKFLFVATYGDGSRPSMTGYSTDTTINVTINKFATASERTGGKWAVFRVVE